MLDYLLVLVGGALGAGARFGLSRWIGAPPSDGWPLATLGANLLGGLLMGLLVGWLARRGGSETARLLLGVGVLGGFTTFSSFSLELVTMVGGGRWLSAAAYALVSTFGAMLLLGGGLWLTRGA